MKKSVKKVLAVVLALTFVAFCFSACGGTGDKKDTGNGYTANNTEYFIGTTGPLTGDAASYGNSVKNGAMLAIDEINAAGGLNGVKFKFDMKDDKATAQDATTGYNSLLEAGMQISLGSVTTDSCDAFAASAVEDNLFYITPSASAAKVIEGRDNGFRVCFGDPDQGTLAADYLTEHYKNVGIIYNTSDTYSTGIYDAFKAEMDAKGTAFKSATFDNETNKDFSTQIEQLKDCDVIFLPMYYQEGSLICKAATAKGCKADLIGSDGFDGIKDLIDAKTVTNKVMYITPFDTDSKDPTVSKFVASYKAKYNALPDQFAADGYDAVYAIFRAMEKAGVNDVTISPSDLCEKVKAAITADDFSLTGATGTMTWDASGACSKPLQFKAVN